MLVYLPFHQFHDAVVGQIHKSVIDGLIFVRQPGVPKELLQPVVLISYPIQN